jgi:hypothetical protein
MIGAAHIAAMLTERISKNDGYRPADDVQVRELVEHLFEIIQNFLSESSFEIEEESTLHHADSFSYSSEDECQESEIDEEVQSEEEMEESDEQLVQKFSLDYMEKVLNYNDEVDANGKRKHSWRGVHHRFRRIPCRQYLCRFRDYVVRQGSKRQKIDEIDSFVFELFEGAREQSLCIHDIDLRRWALQKARQQSMSEFSGNFQVSNLWLL